MYIGVTTTQASRISRECVWHYWLACQRCSYLGLVEEKRNSLEARQETYQLNAMASQERLSRSRPRPFTFPSFFSLLASQIVPSQARLPPPRANRPAAHFLQVAWLQLDLTIKLERICRILFRKEERNEIESPRFECQEGSAPATEQKVTRRSSNQLSGVARLEDDPCSQSGTIRTEWLMDWTL